jgi:hypothetical protein
LLEHRDAFFQPAPDGTVDECAAGFAMAGIIEPDKGAIVLGRPCVERNLKPPSQNSPGEPPARVRTAIRRASLLLLWPTSIKTG